MEQSLCILGRQPALGLAELERLYGPTKLRPVGAQAVVLELSPQMLGFSRLGGSIKLCEVLTTFTTVSWAETQKSLTKFISERVQQLPAGKLQLGISAYGLETTTQQLTAAVLALKKVLRASGRSVRVVPNQAAALNSAQVIHNHLTGPTGWEVVLVRDGNTTICARTLQEQNIADYTVRDRHRPKRDARVGMLPPKLAQIIINLANPPIKGVVLDPFCGTGVILQEALLMGYSAYGTDLEPRMVEYSQKNLDWLQTQYGLHKPHALLEQADATTFQKHSTFDAVASEVYLGRPFTSLPSREILSQTVSDCNLIIKKFLENLHPQVPSGLPLCLAIPAWQTAPGSFKHLPLIDQLNDLGYNRVSFEHVRNEKLLYYREAQIVARELLVITRK